MMRAPKSSSLKWCMKTSNSPKSTKFSTTWWTQQMRLPTPLVPLTSREPLSRSERSSKSCKRDLEMNRERGEEYCLSQIQIWTSSRARTRGSISLVWPTSLWLSQTKQRRLKTETAVKERIPLASTSGAVKSTLWLSSLEKPTLSASSKFKLRLGAKTTNWWMKDNLKMSLQIWLTPETNTSRQQTMRSTSSQWPWAPQLDAAWPNQRGVTKL